MARKKKTVENILITDIADKGMAVGRDDEGIVYFVTGAVPGDVVDVIVLRKKKSYRTGMVKSFKKYSPERIDAFCSHFGNCGGCKWQNLDYPSQLKYKEKLIHDAFSRLGHIEIKEIRPILGCAKTREYRNKMEYSFSARRWVPQEELDREEEVSFGPATGFHKAGAFDKVVQIDKCYLQEDFTNVVRNRIDQFARQHNFSFYHARDHYGLLRNMVVRNTTLGEWMLVLSFGESQKENIDMLLEMIVAEFPQITSLYYVINTKKNDSLADLELTHYNGALAIKEKLGNITYEIGPKSFFQTNTYQAEKLYEQVSQLAGLSGKEIVYDLYTGLGSIALYLAANCKKVVGVEEVREAIDDANKNKLANNITNASFEVGDVKEVFGNAFIEKHGHADLIVVDPPRAGLHADVVDTLNQSGVEKIIYVSCNPATQARDLGLMSDHYSVELIQPVDMFPHTHHIENIAVLKRIPR